MLAALHVGCPLSVLGGCVGWERRPRETSGGLRRGSVRGAPQVGHCSAVVRLEFRFPELRKSLVHRSGEMRGASLAHWPMRGPVSNRRKVLEE